MISNLIPKQVITIIQSQINLNLGINTLLSGGRDKERKSLPVFVP